MTINAMLKIIETGLTPFARSIGAPLNKCGDIDALITQLQESPGAPRVVILFHDELKRGDYEESSGVDRTFWIAIARGKGLALEPGANLTRGVAGGRPLYDLAEQARQIARGLQFDNATTEVSPNYKSIEPLSVNGMTFTDVLKIEFSIFDLLDAP